MRLFLAIVAFLSGVVSFKHPLRDSGVQGLVKLKQVPVAPERRKCMRLGAIQVKIYGTKNAYTSLRPYDVVLYKMDKEIDDKETALGLYLGGTEEEMRLLCCEEAAGIKFNIDENYEPLNAQALQSNGQILRVITADRVRDSTSSVIIEEWLSGDIFIPIGDGKTLIKPRAKLNIDNLDEYLEMAEKGIDIDPVSMIAEQTQVQAQVQAQTKSQTKSQSGGGVTLEDLEREVLAMEDQLNKILGMISRLKRTQKN